MREIKNFTVITLVLVATLAAAKYSLKALPFIILAFFLLNLFLRRRPGARSYFTSKLNLFTSKGSYEYRTEMPASLLHEKLKEVIQSSGYKLFHEDQEAGHLYATSSMSWFSWGENLYFDVIDEGEGSLLKLTSAGFFQLSYSFGKHDANYSKLISQFEESMII